MSEQVAGTALAALVLLPVGAGLLLLVAGRRGDRVAPAAAFVASSAGVVLGLVVAVTRPSLTAPFIGIVDGGDLGLAVDGLSAVMVVTVTTVTAALVCFAAVDLAADAARARFMGYVLVFAGAMLTTVTATTLPTLLLAWEVMGATSYALIAYRWERPGKLPAGTTAFLTTRAADLGLYVAAGAVLAGSGSLALGALAAAEGGWRDVAAAGVLVAALGKSAQLPFSAWLSAAMQGPSAVSALLHSATMVAAGGYLLLRTGALLQEVGWAATSAAWVGTLTALVLGAVACAQTDLKQLLAASTAAQIGFVVLAAGVGVTAGGAAHLVAHAAVKAALFVAAGAWLTALGTRRLTGLVGAARRYRGTGAAATVAALALAGVPPLSLWATKDEILAGVHGSALQVSSLAAAALSAAYAAKMLAVVLSRAAPPQTSLDDEEHGTRAVPWASTVVAATLASFAAALGVLAVPAVADMVKRWLGMSGEPSPGWALITFSGALALAVLALVMFRPAVLDPLGARPLTAWLGMGRLLSPAPALAVGRALARVDTHVIDRAVVGTATAVRRLSLVAGDSDVRVVDGAVRRAAAAFRRVGAAAVRPQTGLLHQYYVQVLVGLGVLFVLLLVVR